MYYTINICVEMQIAADSWQYSIVLRDEWVNEIQALKR